MSTEVGFHDVTSVTVSALKVFDTFVARDIFITNEHGIVLKVTMYSNEKDIVMPTEQQDED